MRVARLVLSFVLVILVSSPRLKSQSTTAVQRDTQAITLIAQSLSTMGALASPSRMTLAQGTATYPDGTTMPVSMKTISRPVASSLTVTQTCRTGAGRDAMWPPERKL
jgi:hypothetical protein